MENTKSQSGEREELKKKIKNAMGDVMIKVSSSDSAVFNGMEFHNPDPVESLLELFLKELSESKKEGKMEILKELKELAEYGAKEFDGDEHSQLLNLCNAIYHLQKWGKLV